MLDHHELETGHYLSGRVSYVNTNGDKNNFEGNKGCEKVQKALEQVPHSEEGSKTGKIESGWAKDI